MRKKINLLLFLIISVCLLNTGIFAAEKINVKDKEIVNFINKAVQYMEKNGTTKQKEAEVFKKFDDPKGIFVKGDIYLFTYNFDGVCLQNCMFPNLENLGLLDMKSPDGKLIIKEMIEGTKKNGQAWITFKWPYPNSKKIGTKRTFYKGVAGKNIFIGAGYYL